MSIETDALDALYAQIKPKGVTMTALLAKAVGVALAAHPLLYATLSADATQVTYNEKASGGLLTPCVACACVDSGSRPCALGEHRCGCCAGRRSDHAGAVGGVDD